MNYRTYIHTILFLINIKETGQNRKLMLYFDEINYIFQ